MRSKKMKKKRNCQHYFCERKKINITLQNKKIYKIKVKMKKEKKVKKKKNIKTDGKREKLSEMTRE